MATAKARLLRVLSLGLPLSPVLFAAPTLTVRVYNHAAVPAAELEAAEREAQNIFQPTGVKLEWVECAVSPEEAEKAAACDRVLNRPGPSLKLLPESMAAGLPRPAEKFAIAIPSMIFVFCQRVREAAEKSGIPEPRMLGGILAHELGHEALGESSHSATGIMKARLLAADFALAERGLLRFSNGEARRLRARLQQ